MTVNPRISPNPHERDRLRHLFSQLGMDARVITAEFTGRSISMDRMPLPDARKLITALETIAETQVGPR
jgi:hypothetical protein